MSLAPKRANLPPFLGVPLGHYWTIVHHLRRQNRHTLGGTEEPIEVLVSDAHTVNLTLSGVVHEARLEPGQSARDLLVLIHGLGGSASSGYMVEALAAGLAQGCAVLRVNLRGADARGSDFYHAGLYTDVLRVLQHDVVRRHHNVYVLGISLGGHVLLRAAGHGPPANVRAIAALCPPLDLAACSAAFDKKRQWVYRRHILNSLKLMYTRFAAHHPQVRRSLGLPSVEHARTIQSMSEWDRSVVAPRHGFESAEHYYATQSAGPRLDAVGLPALILTTRWDPMVPHHTNAGLLDPRAVAVNPPIPTPSGASKDGVNEEDAPWNVRHLTRQVKHVELRQGGHIAFPAATGTSVLAHTIGWLKRHAD